MTENQKENGNKLYKFMMQGDYFTKEEMLNYLGWNIRKERQLRDLISLIAKTKEDKELVFHQWLENDSRIRNLQERNEPLKKFIDKFGGITI